MFLRFNKKKDVLAYLVSVMGIENFVDEHVINHVYPDNDFSWADLSIIAIIMLSLDKKGFDMEAAIKIQERIGHIHKPFILFDIDGNIASYQSGEGWSRVYVRHFIKHPRRLWKFRQVMIKKGYNPSIFMFRNYHDEAYVTNKLEGVERAWKLLTNG